MKTNLQGLIMPRKPRTSNAGTDTPQTKNSGNTGKSQVILTLASILFALVFGLIGVSANPIIIAASVATILGVIFLGKPAWSIWTILTIGLLIAGLLPLYFDALATKAIWGISLMGIMLLFGALFKVITTPKLTESTPGFIWVALIFILFSILATLANWYSFDEFIGGFKRYFQVWGVMFALAWFAFTPDHIRRWRTFILITACLQLPFALFELYHIVPIRQGLALSIPGMVPIDAVAGTFGSSLDGGGANSAMALFLVMIMAFLLAQFEVKKLSKAKLIWLCLLVLPPLFIGETKAVLVWLPLMFITLYRKEFLVRPIYGLGALVFGGLLTLAVGYAYLSLDNASSFSELIQNTLGYNIYNVGYGNLLLNRTTVLSFWASQQGMHDPIGLLIGHGLGSAHIAKGHIDLHYFHYGVGLTAASTLLWELGILGTGLFLFVFISAWRCSNKLQKHTTDPNVRADMKAMQVAILLFSIYTFFRIDILELLSLQIALAVMLGYLAWLHRQQFVLSQRKSL